MNLQSRLLKLISSHPGLGILAQLNIPVSHRHNTTLISRGHGVMGFKKCLKIACEIALFLVFYLVFLSQLSHEISPTAVQTLCSNPNRSQAMGDVTRLIC